MLMTDQEIHDEAERLRTFLRTQVDESGLPQVAVARNAELREEELAAILREDGPALACGQVLAVVVAIGFAPRRFYAEFYGFPTVELEAQVATLIDLLVAKGVMTEAELLEAARDRSTTEIESHGRRRTRPAT